MKIDKKISIILPVYKEEVIENFNRALFSVLNSLTDLYTFEVIYVVDKSRDNALEILKKIADGEGRQRVLVFSRRFGHQRSVVAGLDACTGKATIMMDYDFEHPPSKIPESLKQFEADYNIANHAGYKILNHLYLSNKIILEIGPVDLAHNNYWKGKPAYYYTIDIRDKFLTQSKKKLDELSIPNRTHQIQTSSIPLDDNSLDMIIGFYVLEHLNPLNYYFNKLKRLLKPGGLLLGGIPTEGGLSWGLGRYFSSRKYIIKHSKLDPDKIICWEHPNFALEILYLLSNNLISVKINYRSFRIKLLDINIIITFIAIKSE